MSPTAVPIICMACGTTGAVNRVTAGLRCTCGSTDIDLHEPGSEPFLAAMGVTANSGGTGWGKTMPDPLKGLNEYAGPMPGPNPFAERKGPQICRNCLGDGYDLMDKGKCRACKGTGKRTPSTDPDGATPQVAKHPGQTKTPFVGRRRRQGGRTSTDPLGSPEQHIRETTPGYTNQGYHAPGEHFDESKPDSFYPRFPNVSPHLKTRQDRDYSVKPEKPLTLDAAPCPECSHTPTHLVTDNTPAQDGWWHCPNCGPLTNVDKNPEVNPFDSSTYKGRDSGFRSANKRSDKPGRVMQMIARVQATNSGLNTREVVSIVLRTVQKYSE